MRANKLVLTAGAWTTASFVELLVPLRRDGSWQFWYTSPNIAEYRRGAFPAFYAETVSGAFYGFPAINDLGIKLAEHTGGERVEDPDELDCGLHKGDESGVRDFMSAVLPQIQPERTKFSVCMYSMTADEHFLVDRHPRHPNVVLAGLLWAWVQVFVGDGVVLADLTIDGTTQHPTGFLGLGRFTSF